MSIHQDLQHPGFHGFPWTSKISKTSVVIGIELLFLYFINEKKIYKEKHIINNIPSQKSL